MYTPRLLIWSVTFTEEPDMSSVDVSEMEECKMFWGVPRNIASVLSGFNCKPFTTNHCRTASAVFSVWFIAYCLSEDLNDTYNWVSSAYWWCFNPALLITFPTGDTWSANRMGPRTDPCGTPYLHGSFSEQPSLIFTNWVLSDKYDLIQVRARSDIPKVLQDVTVVYHVQGHQMQQKCQVLQAMSDFFHPLICIHH